MSKGNRFFKKQHFIRFMISRLFLLILWSSLTAIASAATAEKGQLGELILTTSNSYANPFDVTLQATFTKGSLNYTFWGFHAGANTWKVRYNLNDTGTWNYTTFSSDAQLNGKTGLVSIV